MASEINTEIEKAISSKDYTKALQLCRYSGQWARGLSLPFKTPSDDRGICLYYSHRYIEAFECFSKTASWGHLPESDLNHLFNNRWHCLPYVIGLPISPRIPQPRNGNRILFTMTTCKRLDLFIRTLDCFLARCGDLDLIDKWVVVDDNSSQEDRAYMVSRYPWVQFILKSKEEKGHGKSMNIIRNMAVTGGYEYLFHLEDDWELIESRDYLSELISIISCDSSYGQALINKNYIENQDDRVYGGIPARTPSGRLYYIHEYIPEGYEKKHGVNLRNSAYWKHFSFRPGLTRVNVLSTLGPFAEQGFFECEYSERYFSKGFQTVFLPTIYMIHIGKLTFEKSNISNSYQLNKIVQGTVRRETYEEPSKTVDKPHVLEGVLAYVLNLDRRLDRWQKWLEHSRDRVADVTRYERYSAVDGKDLKLSLQLTQLFSMCDYGWRRGMIGCALSHIKMWIDFLKSDKSHLLVLEDDGEICNDFETKLQKVKDQTDMDVIFLGHFYYPSYYQQYKSKIKDHSSPVVEELGYHRAKQESMGGTYGYLCTRKGAEGLLRTIEEIGNTNGIDWMMIEAQQRGVKTGYCMPHLVYSVPATTTGVDTDIQTDFSTLPHRNVLENVLDHYRSKGKTVCYFEPFNSHCPLDKPDVIVLPDSYSLEEMLEDYPQSVIILSGVRHDKGVYFKVYSSFIGDDSKSFTIINDSTLSSKLKKSGEYSIAECLQ
jgi:GR25 family glycosyltransferase involved in LPS biosynthesis